MIEKLKKLLSRSILLNLIVAPYLINFLLTYSFSPSFFGLIAGLLFIEFTYQKLSLIILKRFRFDINIIIIPSFLVVFYCEQLIQIIYQLNSITLNLAILRARYYIPIIWIVFLFFYHWIRPWLNGKYIVLNFFLVVFSLTIFLTNACEHQNLKTPIGHFIPMKESYSKPVILIVLDEYASPKELYKNKSDASIFNFNKALISFGWQVINEQYSYNLATVHSLSSLFNYNYEQNDSNLSIDESLQSLRKSALINALKKRSFIH